MFSFYAGYPRWAEWGNWHLPCETSCGATKQTRKRQCLPCTYDRNCKKLPGSTVEVEDCPDPCPPKCISKIYFLIIHVIAQDVVFNVACSFSLWFEQGRRLFIGYYHLKFHIQSFTTPI